MRYVAKIHVLDVLDTVVVSGYIYDADGGVQDGEGPLEFTYSTPGRGLDHPLTWLEWHLYQAFQQEHRPVKMGRDGAGAEGVLYTVSETGDSVERVMG